MLAGDWQAAGNQEIARLLPAEVPRVTHRRPKQEMLRRAGQFLSQPFPKLLSETGRHRKIEIRVAMPLVVKFNATPRL